MADKPKGQERLVLVQYSTETADDHGQMQPTWTTLFSTWAHVLPLAGRELVVARQLRADVTHELRCPWAASQPITPRMRILAPTTQRTGDLTDGSAVVSDLSTTLDLIPGQVVAATGLPAGAEIRSVDSLTQITLSAEAEATASDAELTIYRVFHVESSINVEDRDLERRVLCREVQTPS